MSRRVDLVILSCVNDLAAGHRIRRNFDFNHAGSSALLF